MPRKNKLIKQKSLRSAFMLYGLVIFAPIFFAFALFVFVRSTNERILEVKNDSVAGAKSVGYSSSLIQDDIKKISTYISLNNYIMNVFETEDISTLTGEELLWFTDKSFDTVQNLVSLNGNIRSFAVYPENGVQPYLRGMDGSVNHSTVERVRDSKEYGVTNRQKYGMYWCPVQKNTRGTFAVNRYDKIVFYRELMDFSHTKPLCFIAISINTSFLEEVCLNSISTPEEKFVIFNEQGEVLCNVGNISDDLTVDISRKIFKGLNREEEIETFSYKKNYITSCKYTDDGFIVCSIIPSSVYTKFTQKILFIFLCAFIFVIVALYLLLEFMYRSVNKPLINLTQSISKFAEGDFSQRVVIESDDELGHVARAFNKMVEDINSLINENYIIKMKEKENELASLQAQINPHFLYNTLNSLYWQALDQGNETLADNIFSLSRLFQLVLSRGKQEIFVENEFELIEHYLEVQKMRFNSKLSYTIELDEKLKGQKFSKLLLQPFVENSIEHGFSNKTSECNLFISGKLAGDRMVFEVKDSGTGMTKEEVQKLFSGEVKVGHDRVGGYAIKNIIDRIKLLYGDKGSVQIKSVLGKGTTVIITVPYEN